MDREEKTHPLPPLLTREGESLNKEGILLKFIRMFPSPFQGEGLGVRAFFKTFFF